MFVVEVIPFVRGSHVDSLTYYASVSYAAGTIVTIPVRSKEVRGLILDSQPVGTAKAAIRAATFSLRKLPEQPHATTLPPALVRTAERLAERLPATVGAILFALLPPEVRAGGQMLHAGGTFTEPATIETVSVLQAPSEERFSAYRSRIREAFAHRGSVLFLVPTSADVERAHEQLSQGIAERVVAFSPLYGVRKIARAYEAFHDMSHAKLIITTPRHAFLDRHDITDIIIEGSRSPFYKSRVRPYVDLRDALKTLAHVTGRTVLLGDLLPNTEDEYRRRAELYLTEGEHPKRLMFPNVLKPVIQNDKPTADTPFSLFAKPVLSALKKAVAERRSVMLLAARRGLAPVVACGDCGYIFRCPDSGTPYSLLRTKKNGEEIRWFLSSTSGKRVRAADTCPSCGSWRLRERGIGIQHINDELQSLLPDVPVVLFDHTTATTHKKAQELMASFYDLKGAMLLATPMALPYIEQPVRHTVVTSLDATRTIPSWRADEELLALLFALRECTEGVVYVQMRTEPDTLIEYAVRGATDQFYTDEIALRESLGYPPFARFVHVSYTGDPETLAETERMIEQAIAPAGIHFYDAAGTATNGGRIRNGLIRVLASEWPDRELLNKLRALPPSIRIEIDPHRIV